LGVQASLAEHAGAVKDTLQAIGKIMKKNKNDAVELFEGSYGTHLVQRSGVERYDTDAAEVGVEITV
jgi:hypothetical protein